MHALRGRDGRNAPGSRDPRRNAQDLALRRPYLLGLADQVGSGSDQAHVTVQDVPQLGQLVQAGLAQQATDAGDALVVARILRICDGISSGTWVTVNSRPSNG